MKIGDDWFTKAMLMKTMSETRDLPSQMGTADSDFSQIFASVLTNLMNQTESKSAIQPNMRSDLFTLSNGNAFQNNIVSNLGELSMNSADSLRFQVITPEKINRLLEGKLKGMGEVFVQAGQLYNVDPSLLSAIAMHETGNGSSRAALVKNNIAGMMGRDGLKSYASVEDSIMDMARNIGKNYLGKGLSSIAEIGNKYAPVGAENDPTGLNNHWVKGVTKFFYQMKNEWLG